MDSLLARDKRFFDALTAGDAAVLEELLAADFLLVAINSGTVVSKTQLVGAITAGTLQFGKIQSFPEEAVVRRVGEVGIVIGRTNMTFTEGGTTSAASRYTHVFQSTPVGWELLSAQGTAIKP
jgi:ketosteroid isomerase-like protein